MMMGMQQQSHGLLVLLLVVFVTGIVSGPSTPRRSRVRRQSMKVRINATGDTIVMKFLHPDADTKLEGYILGYGSSMFSKQFIQLPENGQLYETEFDAEPKYLIAVQPIPSNEVKKHCRGKVQLKKPLHLVIGSVTPTSVLLSWGTLLKTPYEGNVMNDCLEDGHYTVRYRERSRKWNYQTCPTSDTVIDNLRPNAVYEFGVQPNSKDGTGVWSKPVIHNISSGGIEEKTVRKIFKPPVHPVKPLTPIQQSFPFSPRHVLHNRTQGRLPISRKIAPKTTLAPTTTTTQESLSTPGPTLPVAIKQPIGGGDLSTSVMPPFMEVTLASKSHLPLHITATITSVPVTQKNVKEHGGHLRQPQQKPQPKPKPTPLHRTQPLPQLTSKPIPQTHPQSQATSQTIPQTQPQPKAHPTYQAIPQTQPQPQATSQTILQTQPQPKAHPTYQPIPQTQPQATSKTILQTQPLPKPTSKPIPQTQPQPKATYQTILQTQPQPKPHPTYQPIPQTQTNPQPQATSHTILQTQPQPKAHPTYQPIPQTQPQATPKTILQTQPQPKPTSKPIPQPQPKATYQTILQNQSQPKPHPAYQPIPQTQPQATSQTILQTQLQPQHTSKPLTQTHPQPQATSQTILHSQHQATSQPILQTQSQTKPHPTYQPIPQIQLQSKPQPTSKPIPQTQPQFQPTSQPILQTQPQSQSRPKTHSQSQPQTTTQPTPLEHPQIHQPTLLHITKTKQELPKIKIQPLTQPQFRTTPQPQTQQKTKPQLPLKTNLEPQLTSKQQSKDKPAAKPKNSLSQPKHKKKPQQKSKPKAKTHSQSKSQLKFKTKLRPKKQPKPLEKPPKKDQQKPNPKIKPRPKTQPPTKKKAQPVSHNQPIPQPQPSPNAQTQSPLEPLPRPQPQPGLQSQSRTDSDPTKVTPRQAVSPAPSSPREGKPLPRPALATKKAGSYNKGTGVIRKSVAEVPRSPVSSSVLLAGRNSTQSRTRVPPPSPRNSGRPFPPSKTFTSSHRSSTPEADGAHHKGNALPKPGMWSRGKPVPAVLRPPIPAHKRPNLVGKPSDHDKPMDLKKGDKESILKTFPLVTVKPKQERRPQHTTTSAPAVNTSPFDINENSSIFRPLPTSDVDIMGKKRFVAPHVIYKTDKKPDEPCSITSSLSYFPDEEAGDQNVTAPPRNPPSNLTVVTVEGCPSFVILDWQKSDNETREYEVVSTTKGPNGEEVSVLTTNQTHTAVENLKPESSYEFTVTPRNELGFGPSTDAVSFSTESADPRVSEHVTGKTAIWTQFPFKSDDFSECNGKQYVKRTWYRKFVGIQLCNSLRYKIYLSDSLNGRFYNIGDQSGHGEDHCQFVDSFLDGRTGSQMSAEQLPSRPGFYRALRQEPVHFGEIGGNSHVTYVGWYECGTPIPGKW
ncbi:target of Nesh-SH3 isoform X2 [Pseudoliparis swirei]|uniref:target of Nesh-SH3 isoform X2 n=1 Tax=Pseudoliparis swirei TaxID=2059687 RepID=UPI0024BE9698|nr:target of Nesh-SH3 isoform X2 [Pseudoliparis swirei]